LLNEFLVFQNRVQFYFLSLFYAAFQFIVHLLVFKDTFILRFLLHLRLELLHFLCKDRGGILVVERKDSRKPEVFCGYNPRN
jgi:hypothetical protein